MPRQGEDARLSRRRVLQGSAAAIAAAAAGPILLGRSAAASEPVAPIDSTTLKTLVPQIDLTSQPSWVTLSNRAWQIGSTNIQKGTAQNGFAARYMDEGFNDRVFLWDSCFMSMWARWAPDTFPGIQSLDNFYGKRLTTGSNVGFWDRELKEVDGSWVWYPDPSNPPPAGARSNNNTNPPLEAYAEWLYYTLTGDVKRLTTVLPALTSHFYWIKSHRRNANGLYWTTLLASGMDNSPRTGSGLSWIDLSAQQALNARSIARIARAIGTADAKSIANTFDTEYEALKKLINDHMWDDRSGFYYDIRPDGSFTNVKTIGTFWTMLAGIPDAARAERLVGHLRNQAEFARPHSFPSLSADNGSYSKFGSYWRGGVWAPTTMMVIDGLQAYGYSADASKAARNHVSNMVAVYNSSGPQWGAGQIWEAYAPEVVAPATNGGGYARPNFVGWSGVGPIDLFYRYILGIQPDAPSNTISWRLETIQKHGLSNLRFGGKTEKGTKTVSLNASARANLYSPVTVSVEATNVDAAHPLTLKLDTTRSIVTRTITAPGKYTFSNLL
ncbi:MGH1-like glycoside hydrolase domain-containing protein [Actinoplanes sp. CA-030573]|uniref:MGH1-like glycoside hydrolase domain-containing protein n=1 Tax=Actinoplanes sp. CA-030573 TaxID=3239898 RepID=UPI003D8E481A